MMNSYWAAISTVAKRELSAYFESPVAYVFLVIFLLLAGFFTFTFGGFFERRCSPGCRGCSFFSCRRSACGCGPRSGAWERSSCC